MDIFVSFFKPLADEGYSAYHFNVDLYVPVIGFREITVCCATDLHFQSPHPPGQPLALGFDQEQKIKEALSNTFLESSIMINRCYFLPGLF